jgi:hypothetical protein
VPPDTHCTCFIVLVSLLIFKLTFKGFLYVSPLWVYFVLFHPFCCSPLPLYLPPSPLFQLLSVHTFISSTFTDVMFYDVTDDLSFSFPFPLSLSSMEQFYYDKHILHLSLYMFFFWIYLPRMRENMWPLCFWSWLTSLNIMPSNCIHFQTTCHYPFWLSKTSVYTPHFLMHS